MTGPRTFPDELLVTVPGQLCGDEGDWWMDIPLAPFSADDEYLPATWRPGTDGPELIETSISAEGLALPGSTLADFAGKTFTFPTNPTPGFIDASIYLGAAHNPVDITRVEFGALNGDQITARITCTLEFGVELDDVASRSAVLDVVLGPELDDSISSG